MLYLLLVGNNQQMVFLLYDRCPVTVTPSSITLFSSSMTVGSS